MRRPKFHSRVEPETSEDYSRRVLLPFEDLARPLDLVVPQLHLDVGRPAIVVRLPLHPPLKNLHGGDKSLDTERIVDGDVGRACNYFNKMHYC